MVLVLVLVLGRILVLVLVLVLVLGRILVLVLVAGRVLVPVRCLVGVLVLVLGPVRVVRVPSGDLVRRVGLLLRAGRGQRRPGGVGGPVRRGRGRAVVRTPDVAAAPLVPALAALVVHRDGLHRLGRRPDRDDVGGPERRPLGAAVRLRAPGRDGWRQGVAAGTADPGHAAVVDQDGRTGLQYRLVARGTAAGEPVVGDPGVPAQPDRCQRPQVRGDGGLPDPQRGGEGPALVPVPGEEVDLALHVAAGDVARAAVQARVRPVDLQGAGALHPAVGAAGGGRGDVAGRGLPRGRGGERIGARGRGGLEEDLPAGRPVAGHEGEGEHGGRSHDHRGAGAQHGLARSPAADRAPGPVRGAGSAGPRARRPGWWRGSGGRRGPRGQRGAGRRSAGRQGPGGRRGRRCGQLVRGASGERTRRGPGGAAGRRGQGGHDALPSGEGVGGMAAFRIFVLLNGGCGPRRGVRASGP